MKFIYMMLSYKWLYCSALVVCLSTAVWADAHDTDLNAGWIRRYPVMEYTWDSSQPAVDGWPTNGQTVVWRSYVKNWMTNDVTVPYAWFLDGALVASGTVLCVAGVHSTVDFEWPWTFDRHELVFEIDSGDTVEEFSELNNRVKVFTDAITVGFWVEQGLYDYFHTYQRYLQIGANSWEDWAQRHVDRWNQMFEAARYGADTPLGVLDRIRLDNITIVPDGALPLNGGLPTNNPDSTNRTIDLQWGFTEGHIPMYNQHTAINDDNPFFFEQSLLHELGHARYLIDTYGFNVHDTPSYNPPGGVVWSNITITVNGRLIVGSPYMPSRPPWYDSVYFPTEFGTPGYGLMSGPKTLVDQYSAMAMNLIAGHRAVRGNMNSPGNIGVYLQDLPQQNRMLLMDNYGRILSNATVKVYQAGYLSGSWYGKKYDDIPDLELTTDSHGWVDVGRCPFDTDGTLNHTYGIANGVPIIRVEKNAKTGFGFFTVMDFNMNYWRGITNSADYQLRVTMIGDQFGIAGILPCDGHQTPFTSIAMHAVIDGTNTAANVRVNGVSASYAYGRWNRTVSLAKGTNTVTVIANGHSGESATQTVTYIRQDAAPPVIGKEILLNPFPGAELVLGEPVYVRWIRQRIIDTVDANNCRITRLSVVRASDRQEIGVIGEELINSGQASWTPEVLSITPDEELFLKFTVRDTSYNSTNRILVRNPFTVIPEPNGIAAAVIFTLLVRFRKIAGV